MRLRQARAASGEGRTGPRGRRGADPNEVSGRIAGPNAENGGAPEKRGRGASPFRSPSGDHEASGCYVTDACSEVRGLAHADSCHELRLLRLLRDEYIAKLPDGEEVLGDYGNKARRIAEAIDTEENARDVYLELYERHVVRIVAPIMNGRWDEAYGFYRAMCEEMEERYLREDPIPASIAGPQTRRAQR